MSAFGFADEEKKLTNPGQPQPIVSAITAAGASLVESDPRQVSSLTEKALRTLGDHGPALQGLTTEQLFNLYWFRGFFRKTVVGFIEAEVQRRGETYWKEVAEKKLVYKINHPEDPECLAFVPPPIASDL